MKEAPSLRPPQGWRVGAEGGRRCQNVAHHSTNTGQQTAPLERRKPHPLCYLLCFQDQVKVLASVSVALKVPVMSAQPRDVDPNSWETHGKDLWRVFTQSCNKPQWRPMAVQAGPHSPVGSQRGPIGAQASRHSGQTPQLQPSTPSKKLEPLCPQQSI